MIGLEPIPLRAGQDLRRSHLSMYIAKPESKYITFKGQFQVSIPSQIHIIAIEAVYG